MTITLTREELLAAMSANRTPERPTRPMTTTEQSAAAGSKFARPDFARQAAAVAKPEPAWKSQPATAAQIDGIANRLAAREGNPEADKIRQALDLVIDRGRLDKGMASEFITALDRIRPNPRPQAAPQAPQGPQVAPGDDAWKRPNAVPDGNYALVGDDGVVRFFEVHTVDEPGSKFHGVCCVKRHASDERYPVRGRERHQVLDRLVADPTAAMRLYGYKSLSCGRCGRELSKAQSRATGFGSTCARKMDVHYCSEEEALAILDEGNVSTEGISDLEEIRARHSR